jgi:xanthine dehydrogenase YagS FAD-binding subunit
VAGPNGERRIPIQEFHRLPGDTPHVDTTLAHDEVIRCVDLPAEGFADHYTYLKLRDRQSYAFALVSVAVGLTMQSGVIQTARLAMGGVAHKPWRVVEAEAMLQGQPAGEDLFHAVAERMMRGAVAQADNGFKIPLGVRAVRRALAQAAAGTPQPVAQKRLV